MRKTRLLQKGATYHVIARANRREMILESAQMKEVFIGVVRRAKLKYRFKLENFTVMGNHFHFIVRPCDEECLSRIMQWILGVFAMTYNRRFGLTGHVWGERFKSWILSSLQEYLKVFNYIDNNPVSAKLVEQADAWIYGGAGQRRRGDLSLVDAPM